MTSDGSENSRAEDPSQGLGNDTFGELLEQIAGQLRLGRPADIRGLQQRYPQFAAQIVQLLPTLEAMVELGQSTDTGEPPVPFREQPESAKTLGDFRIVRELGRGGMGVVYEAEQLSMGRSVALKVLPFAALAQERALQRFRNEVRAAAALDHAHIVSVFSVGEERGVHYFAMQLIRGQTLTQVIQELAYKGREVNALTLHQSVEAAELTWENSAGPHDAIEQLPTMQPDVLARISTSKNTDHNTEFYRAVARLGIQAAQGLQHAHDQGVLHRDIKPGNLILDATGQLYITDFGLARIEAEVGVTLTGDLIGTLRYMSPEQALAKRNLIDHRSDIYSLGVTLYELLTLRPPYDGVNRQELLKQIAFDDPPPPRQIDRSIPRELETIVLKAMGKEPAERYASASDLADDLQRFLLFQPIKAEPPTLRDRVRKWSMRHQSLVWSGVALLLITTAALAISTLVVLEQQDETAHALMTAKDNFRTSETHRLAAEQAVDLAQQVLYVRNLSLAAQAIQQGEMRRAAILMRSNPAYAERPELRGFEWYYLAQRALDEHDVLTQNQGEVFSVAYSPNGRQIAVGNVDGSVELWDTQARHQSQVLLGHTASVTSLDFHPDGSQLATASMDGTVRVWPLSSMAEVAVISTNPGEETTVVCFSPDGTLLATGGEDTLVKLWSGPQFEQRAVLSGHTGVVRCLAFVDAGRTLVSGANDETIRLWDVGSGREIDTLRGHNDLVLALAVEPAGKLLVSGGNDHLIHVWDIQQRACLSVIRGHLDAVQSLAFLGHSSRLLSGDRGGTIRIWDLEKALRGELANDSKPNEPLQGIDALGVTLQGHSDRVWSIDTSADGRNVLTGSRDGSVRIWPIEREEARLTPNHHVPEIEDFEVMDKSSALAILNDFGVGFWDSHNGQWLDSFPYAAAISMNAATQDLRISLARAVAYSAGTDAIAVGYGDGRVVICFAGGRLTHEWIAAEEAEGSESQSLISKLTFSPDGTTLVTAVDFFNQFRVWDLSTYEMLAELNSTEDCMAFSPDGKFLACADYRECLIFDTHTWQETFKLTDHSITITDIAFNAQGTLLATCSEDRRIVLWDTANWTRSSEIYAHAARVESIAFSPDGRTLASGAIDGTVKLWNVELGLELFELERQSSPVNKVAFAPDGQQLFVHLEDETMSIFDIHRPRRVAANSRVGTGELSTFDFGDAPQNYSSAWLADDVARHVARGLTLGPTRDAEPYGKHSTTADADGDDEDGVKFGSLRVGALAAQVTVNVQGADGRLDAWIDFNGDGSWGGAAEKIFASLQVNEGDNLLKFDVPSSAVLGTTYARFRLSTAGKLGYQGDAADGEIEDYRVAIISPVATGGVFGEPRIISTDAKGAQHVFATDMDADGDMDVLSASSKDNKAAWYVSHSSQKFKQFLFSGIANYAICVFAVDLDGDGDMDALSASSKDNRIAWYENDGTQFFVTHTIAAEAVGAVWVIAADMDGDGDQDVLSASSTDNKIAWYENEGDRTFVPHTINTTAEFVRCVFAADVDGDGDQDVLSASSNDDKIAWYENDGRQHFTPHIISTEADSARCVLATDLDGDGDQDVLSASARDDKIAWYENDGQQDFTPHIISTATDGPISVFAADMDGDGDLDVLSASAYDGQIAWFRNDGRQNFTQHTITMAAAEARCVFAADIDEDGDLDVLSASRDNDTIAWYENLAEGNSAEQP